MNADERFAWRPVNSALDAASSLDGLSLNRPDPCEPFARPVRSLEFFSD
jgi:hypothetical protein